MSISEQVLEYMQAPTQESFIALRETVAAAPGFSRYASYEAVGFPLVEEQKFSEALQALQAMLPESFLSPGLHNLLAYIHVSLGNAEGAGQESYLAAVIMGSILATGDGSETRPYLVLQVSDEYDILRVLRKESAAQTLFRRGGRILDRHQCSDTSVIWFDVTTQAAQQPAA